LNAHELDNAGGWCAQLSRSIDSRVNSFDPSIQQSFKAINIESYEWSPVEDKSTELSRKYETANNKVYSYGRCLDQKKGRLVDNSIHITNVHHIRRAKHSIYIESQYFMGSSFMWSNHRDVKCGNMIAAEVRISLFFVMNSPFGLILITISLFS
jgi:phospholipase D1/2